MRLGIVVLVAMWLAAPANAGWTVSVINNGLAPPNPANVIDADESLGTVVQVHNVGCDPVDIDFGVPADPCSIPWGDPTSVEVVGNGGWSLLASYESSTVTVSGGTGFVFLAYDSSSATITGGALNLLIAWGSSTIGIVGANFAINGEPAALGPIALSQGSLTGTLESGETLDTGFCHDGCSDYVPVPKGVFATGLITLIPEPDAALLFPVAALSLEALRRLRAS